MKALSGGERNRLLLARLFTRPANVLVLDEPTNDLDLETLELLEEQLVEWPGTLLLVSHDRAFLDNVVTSTFVFEGDGRVQEYVGGYEDWVRQARAERSEGPARREGARRRAGASADRPTAPGRREAEEAVVQGAARARRAAGAHRGARSRAARARTNDRERRLLQGSRGRDQAVAGAGRRAAGASSRGGLRAVGRARMLRARHWD